MDSLGNEKTMMPGEGGRKAGLAPGDVLGQYRVLRLLGKGGMGEVHLVEHSILTTRHALKLLPEERSASEAFLQRFHDEARVMAKLRHPGIVHVTHADAAKDRHYLIMDFVGADGGEEPFDLEEALAGAPDNRLPASVVARLGAQICAAVEAAHKAGVIHRDLKPANVLLTSRDLEKAEARVTDFGLARLLGEEWVQSLVNVSMQRSMSMGGMPTMAKRRSERSSTGAILGTYEYMSPEQREGGEVDERSDIFALGVMLYRMVTGKRLVGRAKAASRIVEDLDGDWDELIDACLEEDPEERPATISEVKGHLNRLESAEKEKRSKRAREEAERRERLRREREEEARRAAEREEIQRVRDEKKRREEEQQISTEWREVIEAGIRSHAMWRIAGRIRGACTEWAAMPGSAAPWTRAVVRLGLGAARLGTTTVRTPCVVPAATAAVRFATTAAAFGWCCLADPPSPRLWQDRGLAPLQRRNPS
jgi:serine/threonine protein kinase